jgi:ketosteroid isomerase-like protein
VSEENLQITRRGWEAYLRGDMDALASLWAPEVVWDLQHFRNWPESSYHGVDGVRQFVTEWLEVWGDYEVEVEELLPAPDGRVVSLITHRAKGRQSGLPMNLSMALTATLRNGKIIRFDTYDDRAEALDAAGLRVPRKG